MAVISSPSLSATPPSASSPSAACVQIRPASLCFEVKDVTPVAAKVNGAAQYIFKVAFAPTKNSAVPAVDAIEVEIPLHAASYKEALVILQAYGQAVRTKTPTEVREMIKNLKYSAVLIDGDDVKFREYDSKTHRFKEAHVTQHITSAIDKELDQYAKILISNNTPIGEDTTVNAPTITLQRREPVVKLVRRRSVPSISSTVELTGGPARRASEGSLPVVKESKADAKKRFHGYIDNIKLQPKSVSEDVLTQFDELFGSGFGAEIINNRKDAINTSTEELLYQIAYKKFLQNKTKPTNQEIMELHKTLLQIIDRRGATQYLDMFKHIVNMAIDKKFL